MKKIKMFIATLLLACMAQSSYAIWIIDINGEGSITADSGGTWTVDCCTSDKCCGTIVINCEPGAPSNGDDVTINQCYGSSFDNISHQWTGNYVSASSGTDKDQCKVITIKLDNGQQIF